ncbi:ABC transporter ATP-binding protein [Timonella sp. A28]|uniref:ABC transporter ATP-binding protein n=1 Tax=Timonella sp. A28 TaxID=3442640 RepID=UPI003EBD228A
MALSVEDVKVAFNDFVAVNDVSLTVGDGEILGLLGPSGCGKSTLLRTIAGIEIPQQGRIVWNTHDMSFTPIHKRGFGLMFQDGQLFPHRNVAGNVSYGLKNLNISRVEQQRRVSELLELVGLGGQHTRDVTTMSGGERQRVALARALAPRPQLLLLDEPLSALDRELRERLAVDVRSILRETRTTAVFVTHDQDEAFTVSDRVAVMRAGRVVHVDTPEKLWRSPADREVAEFLGYEAVVSMDPFVGCAPKDFKVVDTNVSTTSEPHTTGVTGAADDELYGVVVDRFFQSGRAVTRVRVPDIGVLTCVVDSHLEPQIEDRVRLVRV